MAETNHPKKMKARLEIDDLDLSPWVIEKLKNAQLWTFDKILQHTNSELQHLLKVSVAESESIIRKASSEVVRENPVEACSLLEQTGPALCTGLLRECEGIFPGTVTEVYGESGCGKTQFSLHLSIRAQLPTQHRGLHSRVLYIHTEGDFPIKRFEEMSLSFKKQHPQYHNLKLSDNLILKKVKYFKELVHVLRKGVPDLVESSTNTKVLIIDSVAALLRCEFTDFNTRTSMIQELALEIWKISKKLGLLVLCVNQVSASLESGENDNPSLGLLWANWLTTRLKISKTPSESQPTKRTLKVVFSSYHPNVSADFVIDSGGLHAV